MKNYKLSLVLSYSEEDLKDADTLRGSDGQLDEGKIQQFLEDEMDELLSNAGSIDTEFTIEELTAKKV